MIKRFRFQVVAVFVISLVVSAYWFMHVSSVQSVQDDHGWQQPVESVAGDEPITPIPLSAKLDKAKVALGQRLFNDSNLSHNSATSCAHCHVLSHVGEIEHLDAADVSSEQMVSNVPSLYNVSFNVMKLPDGSMATMESQLDAHLLDPAVMGAGWSAVVSALQNDQRYRNDFAALYEEGIKRETIKDALVTFERSLITPNAPFDRFLRGEPDSLDGEAFAGYQLFKELGCINCHQGVNVGGNMYAKRGVFDGYGDTCCDKSQVGSERDGRVDIGLKPHQFRVASLRNVALTAPYFHDSSADTLEQAVIIMGKSQLGVELRPEELTALVAFLHSLSGDVSLSSASEGDK